MRTISRLLLRWLGWTLTGSLPGLHKYVIILVPHKSMWDFFAGKLYLMSVGVYPRILVKHELFFFPLGYIIRWLGGIPVNRKKSNNTVQKISSLLLTQDDLIVAITPEGTRQDAPNWRTGFYYIALISGVPIVPVHCHLKNKELKIGPAFYPTGKVAEDIEFLHSYYFSLASESNDIQK